MVKQIFVNLPVKDLDRSMAFFKALGFSFNPQFTDQNAAALVLGENIFAMLLLPEFFKSFIKKELADSSKVTEVINAIGVENRGKVDELVDKALTNGATKSTEVQDYGWMYSRGFEDLDGHLWEVVYTDPKGPPQK